MPGGRRSTSVGPTTSPISHTTSPTYGLNTRKTARTPVTQESIEALTNRVKYAPSGKTFLKSKLLCHVGQPFTVNHLISVLFQITQMSSSTPVPVVMAIQAVAFLLKDVETCNVVDVITKQAAHSITTKLDDDNVADALSRKITDNITARLVDHVVAAISPQVALVHDASQTLTSTIEDAKTLHTSIGRERTEQEDNIKTAADHIEDAADALYDSVETYQKALQILAPSLDATQEKIDQLSSQITKVPVQAHGATHLSYSAAAAAHIPPQVDKALGRAALQARQILLDPLPGGTLFPPDTSKRDMAAKIKSALEAAKDDTTPEGTIRSITTLRNGGIIVELETESLAKWLNNQPGRSALENHLDISNKTTFYDRLNRKTNSKPTPSPQLDGSNRLQSALLNNVKLLPYSMLPTSKQQTISSAKEYVWKVKDSVPGKTEDTCGTCGNQHCTSACNSYRTTRCVNCRSQQHTSWSRSCPEFIKHCKELDDKFPENRMPYFPTEHAWTHATQPAHQDRISTSPQQSPQRPHNPPFGRLCQTTITIPNQPSRERSSQRPQDEELHRIIATLTPPSSFPTSLLSSHPLTSKNNDTDGSLPNSSSNV
ncbi:hypothetical protein P692DRAFT_201867111 [Suillus brevipes Sb2]|nr:hypothetical protein P692DRAFT_201867111 [Suillus brevipes Sb2]